MGRTAPHDIIPTEGSIAVLRALGQALSGRELGKEKIEFIVHIASQKETISVPREEANTLTGIFERLSAGLSIDLTSRNLDLTVDQAAEVLNVSTPYLLNLLEQDEIRHSKEGEDFRIRMGDLVEYKAGVDRKREAVLDELVAEAQESGAYDT